MASRFSSTVKTQCANCGREFIPHVSRQFLGRDLLFFYSGKARVWYWLAGVDVKTTPGTYDLRVRAALPGGRVARTVKPVEIGTVTFRSGDVNVSENFVNPDQASEKRSWRTRDSKSVRSRISSQRHTGLAISLSPLRLRRLIHSA